MVQAMLKSAAKFKSPKTFSGKPFTGVLLEPIAVPYFPDLTKTDPEKDVELSTIREEIIRSANEQLLVRFHALFDHYGIEPGDTGAMNFQLAKAIATDFLPGFQINTPAQSTRPKGSFTVGGESLFNAVNEWNEKNGKTISAACTYLSRHDKRWKGHRVDALETAYHRFKTQCREANTFLENDPIYGELIRVLGLDGLLAQMQKRAKKHGLTIPKKLR